MTMSTTPASIALSKDLKRRGWTFVGPTTIYAFMQAMGLVNDHVDGCFVTRGRASRDPNADAHGRRRRNAQSTDAQCMTEWVSARERSAIVRDPATANLSQSVSIVHCALCILHF